MCPSLCAADSDGELEGRSRVQIVILSNRSPAPLCATDSDGELEGRSRVQLGQTENQTMEICQLLLSLIHAWGVDAEIDRLCETKLGMLRPKHPVCYGLISKHGQRH